jgi:hypothetical protein
MPRGKSIARCTDMIAASSSNNAFDDHESLGIDQDPTPETHATTLNASSSSVQCRHIEGWSLHSGIHLCGSTRLSEKINYNFKFTNIEVARTITLAMKSSRKIPLFSAVRFPNILNGNL